MLIIITGFTQRRVVFKKAVEGALGIRAAEVTGGTGRTEGLVVSVVVVVGVIVGAGNIRLRFVAAKPGDQTG
jgi:hypothetical protein